MKIEVDQKDIIVRGWFKLGPNPDQVQHPSKQRGWIIYPEEQEDSIPVMMIKVDYPISGE